MKIKYTHTSEPNMEKIHDTELVKKNNPFIHFSIEELDKITLEQFQKDKEKGMILSFEVLA